MSNVRIKSIIATAFAIALLAPLCGQASDAPLTIPQTAPEHHARAADYQKKAADARADAESHRQMLAENKKARDPSRSTQNQWVTEMRKHCDGYIKAGDALAQQAEEMAKFHELRAAELEGK